MNFDRAGFSQITAAGAGVGSHDQMDLDVGEIEQNGYVLVYLTNETAEPVSVNFDDLIVTHSKTNIVQEDHYYPFGLTFNSYTSGTKNNYLYNQGLGEKTFKGEAGKAFAVERQLDLDIDLTKYRMYDYALGRFLNVDPLADQAGQEKYTPYHYSLNNPVRYNDPYGDCVGDLPCPQALKDVGEGFSIIGELTGISAAGRAVGKGATAVGKGATAVNKQIVESASKVGQFLQKNFGHYFEDGEGSVLVSEKFNNSETNNRSGDIDTEINVDEFIAPALRANAAGSAMEGFGHGVEMVTTIEGATGAIEEFVESLDVVIESGTREKGTVASGTKEINDSTKVKNKWQSLGDGKWKLIESDTTKTDKE